MKSLYHVLLLLQIVNEFDSFLLKLLAELLTFILQLHSHPLASLELSLVEFQLFVVGEAILEPQSLDFVFLLCDGRNRAFLEYLE